MSRKRGRGGNQGDLYGLHEVALADLFDENKKLKDALEAAKEELKKQKTSNEKQAEEISDLKDQVQTLETEVQAKEEHRLSDFRALTAQINKLSLEKKELKKGRAFEHNQKVNVYDKLVTVATCALRSQEMITELLNEQPGIRPAFADARKRVAEMREERMVANHPRSET